MEISDSTAKRGWTYSMAWRFREIRRSGGPSSATRHGPGSPIKG